MRLFILLLAVLIGTNVSAQKKVKNFSIEMRLVAGMTGTVSTYTIDKNGNGVYVKTVRKEEKQRISFTLDKKALADLQKTVVTDADVYNIPAKVNCDACADGIDITITVNSNRGTKTINGNNPQRVNDKVNSIYKKVKSLVDITQSTE